MVVCSLVRRFPFPSSVVDPLFFLLPLRLLLLLLLLCAFLYWFEVSCEHLAEVDEVDEGEVGEACEDGEECYPSEDG